MSQVSENYSHDTNMPHHNLSKSGSIDTLKRKIGNMKRKKKKSSSRLDMVNSTHDDRNINVD